ncbi:MAG: ATP-binding cassette domain-containing protein, partial [Deltaproteobacteria bacterium]|nr:ATP-binding cassette domain-containing protein [Deltaproteobacteria bacterium]
MEGIALRAQGLGKCYLIGELHKYKTLRDQLASAIHAPARWGRAIFTGDSSVQKSEPLNQIWALKDVSFTIRKGEAVGIIGRNGAGKSTLLKILSRITEPSVGRGEIYGRVGSLLEVGTGFHPELTGRENIFLNAAILGMRKDEIKDKFDGIVNFAEID